jgi:hypothetical protein
VLTGWKKESALVDPGRFDFLGAFLIEPRARKVESELIPADRIEVEVAIVREQYEPKAADSLRSQHRMR